MAAVVHVLFGPTQSGKSTTFNRLTGTGGQRVGDGSGESVTLEPAVHRSELGLLMDTPGMGDTRLQFTNEEASQKVALQVVEAKAKGIKVLVVESLANDSMRLRDTLSNLGLAFGRSILRSTMVLMTKADRLAGEDLRKRVEMIQQVCRELGIRQTAPWRNKDVTEAGHREQLREVQAALARLQGSSTRDIEVLEGLILRRAQQLCAAAAPVKKTIEESYTEEELQDETYPENYVDYEEKKTSRQEVVKTTRREGVNGILQFLTFGTQGNGYDVQSSEVVTLTDTEKVPVTKTRLVPKQVARPVTKYRNTDVEVRLKVDQFLSEAREKVLAESRQLFAAKGRA